MCYPPGARPAAAAYPRVLAEQGIDPLELTCRNFGLQQRPDSVLPSPKLHRTDHRGSGASPGTRRFAPAVWNTKETHPGCVSGRSAPGRSLLFPGPGKVLPQPRQQTATTAASRGSVRLPGTGFCGLPLLWASFKCGPRTRLALRGAVGRSYLPSAPTFSDMSCLGTPPR